MTRRELIDALHARFPNHSLEDVHLVVDQLIQRLTDALLRGHRVELRSFGSFTTHERSARKARNPSSGQAVWVPNRRTVHFRMSKLLQTRLNPNELINLESNNPTAL